MNIVVNSEYIQLKPFVEKIPVSFDHTGELIYDKRNKVRLFNIDGLKIVVKRYKRPLFFQRVDYTCFRPSKAKRAYLFALNLKTLEIQTPDPIAFVEEKKFGLFRQGYFISVFTPHESLKQHLDQLQSDTALFDSYVRFLIMMHEKGFLHGDQNLSNILFYMKDGVYEFEVIDVNRSHFITRPTQVDCLMNLMRITRDRLLSRRVVERYAEMRGWNKDECVAIVFNAIDRYERKRKMRRFYHKIFPKKQ